ncbi:MAG: outer rane efflux protein [Deltaproteobacteria bacterium]|nr:outer rane efflux protein [Deltaproteobacteria bacterium]
MFRIPVVVPLSLMAITIAVLSQAPAAAAALSLKDCLEMALRSNPALKVATHDSSIQAENVALAESGYLPKIDLQAGYSGLVDPQAIKTAGGNFQTQQPDFAYASIGVYHTLYDFGRRGSRKEQALHRESAAASAISAVRQDISLQVINSYYAILQSLKLVDVARDETAQREQHLKMATTLHEQGVTTRNDLLQAEVKLTASRQKLLAVNNQLSNSWLLLNYLTGSPPEFRAILSEEELAAPQTPPANSSVGKRDEIAAQKSLIQAGEASVEESREEFYPEIFVRAGIDYLQNNKAVEQTMVGATVGLKINLFDGMATTSRQRQAVKLLEKEKDRLKEIEELYRLEIQTAQNDLTVARERIELTRSAIRQSEENLRINNDRYKAQIGTATEVIDAQTLLSQTRSDHYQALFDYQVARARVQRAAGEL